MMHSLLVLAVATTLAWANGANDVSKGIATLVGSGVTDYRRAAAWGTAWTGFGGLLGALLSTAMVTTFGSGLIAAGTPTSFGPAVAMLIGATAWVLIATRAGLPVSTTHAIVGSVIGVAAVAYGPGAVQWAALTSKVVLPLLVSPVVALVAAAALTRSTQPGRPAAQPECLCVELAERAPVGASSAGAGTLASRELTLLVSTGTAQECATASPTAARVSLDRIHWLASGATSLARGMNDAPKMVALVAAAFALAPSPAPTQSSLFVVVALAMVGGSAVAGRRVTEVLARKVTRLDHREGLAVNVVTAVLVAAGARFGLPMSTTHVASGGLFGAGLVRGSLDRKTLRDIVLAWVVTLPAAAVLGIMAQRLLALLGW